MYCNLSLLRVYICGSRQSKEKNMNYRMLVLFGLSMLFLSCEGFKVLTLHNFSDVSVDITLKPGLNTMERYEISNYPNAMSISGDSITMELPKDSSIVLTSIFTSFLGGVKLKEYDIRINYLKIRTTDTTIVAYSKQEILSLLKDDSFKYKKKIDKGRDLINSSNWGNIIIRK